MDVFAGTGIVGVVDEILFPPPAPVNLDSFPIALRKGKRSCISHPIAPFVFSDHLSPSLRAFTISVITSSIPKPMSEA